MHTRFYIIRYLSEEEIHFILRKYLYFLWVTEQVEFFNIYRLFQNAKDDWMWREYKIFIFTIFTVYIIYFYKQVFHLTTTRH